MTKRQLTESHLAALKAAGARRKGKKLTEQHKENVRQAHLKKWQDKEWADTRRAQMSEHAKNMPRDGAAISRRLTARWADPEFREKMTAKQSSGATARWADPVKRAELLAARAVAQKARNDSKNSTK